MTNRNDQPRPEVLVFEADAKSVLPVVESFHRMGFRVVAASSQRFCIGFYSRHVRERILMPNERRQPRECIEFLLRLVQRRRFEMIVPLGDEVTHLVCTRRDDFLEHTKLLLVPLDTFMKGRDKVQTMQAAAKVNVPIPRTWYPDAQPLDQIAREVDYPVLVKPAMSNGARGIHYAHDAGELERLYTDVSRAFGRTFVQELIPHEGMQYKTELLLDYESRVLGSFAYAKIRYYPPSGGSSTLNKSLYYPEMVDHAVRLARSIGWYGMCDFDFIYDVRDRQIKLMEINPRWTDTIRIASLGGVDFPKMVYQVVSGQPVDPVTTYRAGLYMRFLPGEVLWFLAARDKRFRTQPSWFRFFAPDTKYLISMLDDPGPLMGYVLECIAALLSPEMRAYRLRTKRKSDPESDPS